MSAGAGKLIAVIGDDYTVTGFLLAGTGFRDVAGTNFLVVNSSALAPAYAASPLHAHAHAHTACRNAPGRD